MITLFRAHNGVDPGPLGNYAPSAISGGFTPNAYNTFPWSEVEQDAAGEFVGGIWRPHAGPIWISAQVYVSGFGGGNCVIKIFKNAAPVPVDTGAGVGGIRQNAGAWSLTIPAWPDVCSGDDTYRVKFFTTSATAVVDGHPAHTWMAGMALGA